MALSKLRGGSGNGLARPLQKYITVSLALWDKVKSNYLTLPEERCEIRLTTFTDKLQRVHALSLKYAENIADLCWFGRSEERLKIVKDGIARRDFGELSAFLRQLNTFLTLSQESYRNLEAALRDVRLSAETTAQICREEGQKKHRRKIATRAVGGTAAAGVLVAGAATGVTLSVIAGVFTLGIGTIVGLSLTAAGTAAGGAVIATGTGVATHGIATYFEKAEKRLLELSEAFDEVLRCALQLDSCITSFKVQVEAISNNIDNVHMTDEAGSSTLFALDRLWQRFDGFDNETFNTLHRELERKGSNLPNHRC